MPLIKPFAQLPLMKIRNVKVDLPLSRRVSVVRSTGIPAKTDPAHFVQTMLDWEARMGTTHAVLAGMMLMTGTAEVDDVIDGFETFHRIYDKVAPFMQNCTLTELERFTTFLKGKLNFAPFYPDFYLGLKSFEANLDGADKIVGDCVVCAAIYDLLYSQAGGIAGAGFRVIDLHTRAYLPDLNYNFEIGSDEQPQEYLRFKPVQSTTPYLFSSMFSFLTVASLLSIIMFVRVETGGKANYKLLSADKLAFLMNWLECAEAINPYHICIYFNKENVYEATGKKGEAALQGTVVDELMGFVGQQIIVA